MENQYRNFFIMLIISFVIMYAVMFLNVDKLDHVYLSTTRTYMSLLMVTPMAVLMLVMMPGMYKDKKKNTAIMISAIIVFATALTFLRQQVLVTDQQYMKAMIPHHSSAIMVSQEANLTDPELKKLAGEIIKSQEEEIAQMKSILKRLKNK